MPDLGLCVVVVSYGTPSVVIDCLETLVPQARELGATVALVDNASVSFRRPVRLWNGPPSDVGRAALSSAR